MPITLLLYRTENSENLGSIARAAANFDFHDIVLIEPQCEITEHSRRLAKHSQPTLDGMKRADASILETFDTLIATQGRSSTALNLVRAPLTPRAITTRLSELDLKHHKVGILFGPEGPGLDIPHLRRADIIMAIPTSRDYPSMNLAQSVTVVLYELSLLRGEEHKITLPYRPMGKNEREALLHTVDAVLDKMEFKLPTQRVTQELLWRRIAGKAFLTKKEYTALMGFLRNVQHLQRTTETKMKPETKAKRL